MACRSRRSVSGAVWPGGGFALDELAESGDREHLPVGVTRLGQSVGVEQQQVAGLQRLVGQTGGGPSQRDA